MITISDIRTTAPDRFLTRLQEKTYETLNTLRIPFQRVETDEIVTMEDCIQVNQKLQMKMVKTLFLCNRQQTEFFLFITCGDKPFKSKEFAGALGISRVSFAPPGLMEERLGTKIGAATVFSVLLDPDRKVRVVFDKDVTCEEWYGCSDGTNTGYMKIETARIVQDFLCYAEHVPTVIRV
jgi:Ala-tRNA(Pro) deacylase